MTNDIQTAIRFPSPLIKKLTKRAKAEHMTTSMYIRRVLMREVGMLPRNVDENTKVPAS